MRSWPEAGAAYTAKKTSVENLILLADHLRHNVPVVRNMTEADTQGLHMQRLGPDVAHYIRVIPGWVEQMKRAVDEANW